MIRKEWKDRIAAAEDRIAAAAEEMSTWLWSHPEISDQEFGASRYLADKAAKKGFRVTIPFAGLETAFLAEFTIGADTAAADAGDAAQGPAPTADAGVAGGPSAPEHIPTAAFLAEYDALPGYGNLSPDGSGNGHACGHNWIAASAFAAAVTLKETLEELAAEDPGLRGRVLLIGTPAEETWGGKIKMSEDGVFRSLGIDAAFECHLSGAPGFCVENYMLACTDIIHTFHGKASHASAHPENGINALDAVNLTYAGISCLRQHLRPATKMHGIVVEGGQACNIVPDHTVMQFYARSAKRDYLETVIEKMNNCAKGAALMTGCTVDIERNRYTFADMRNNGPLMRSMRESMESFGITGFRQDDINTAVTGDIGNASYEVPSLYAIFSTAEVGNGADIHEAGYLKITDSDYAHGLLHTAAKSMAAAALEIVTDEGVRRAVRAAFEAED